MYTVSHISHTHTHAYACAVSGAFARALSYQAHKMHMYACLQKHTLHFTHTESRIFAVNEYTYVSMHNIYIYIYIYTCVRMRSLHQFTCTHAYVF